MMCDMGSLLVRIHYDGSHSTYVETRGGHTFSLARELAATEYKQHAMNSQVASLCCGFNGWQALAWNHAKALHTLICVFLFFMAIMISDTFVHTPVSTL